MPGDFQFPPHSDRHHTISRVGPVHSMSQIRTVPAIPSDTSLFSPPSHNRDFEQTENPEINHPDQEKYPYDSTQESSSLDNCLKPMLHNNLRVLLLTKKKLTPNNHHDRNKNMKTTNLEKMVPTVMLNMKTNPLILTTAGTSPMLHIMLLTLRLHIIRHH